MDLNAGASSNPPALRMATPLAVPLVRSSNLDCSQVRVPSPMAREARNNSTNPEIMMDSRRKFVTSYLVLADEFRVSRAESTKHRSPRDRQERAYRLLHHDGQHLGPRHHVVERTAGSFVHRRFPKHNHVLGSAHSIHHVHNGER